MRTGDKVKPKSTSSIHQHLAEKNHQADQSDFKIIDRASNLRTLLVKEAIHIQILEPCLNEQKDHHASLTLLQ